MPSREPGTQGSYRRFAGRAFRVHAQAAEHFTTLEPRVGHDPFAETEPLRERVEIEVVGELAQHFDVRLVVSGRVGDDVFLEIITGQQRFPQAGRAATVEVVAQVGKGLPTGKPLEGEHEVAAGGLLDVPQDGGVPLQRGDGNDKHGAGTG